MNAPMDLDWLARLRDQLLAIEPDMATDEQLLTDTIDGETDILDQLRAVIRHAVEAELFADALQRHLKVLEQRRSRFEARSDACRSAVRDAMETLGLKSLLAPDFTVSIVPGRPRVVVSDAALLPPEFVRTKSEPNLSAIAAALKEGAEVPGATFSNTAPIITVRRI
jgi:hypothetical protein